MKTTKGYGNNEGFMGTPEERFWRKVNKSKNCWEWGGSVKGRKMMYGSLWVNGKHLLAHRFSYELHNGKISGEINVLHKCDNPLCVNPKHLFLGTAKDNALDRDKKRRRETKLSPKDVIMIRKVYKTKQINQFQLADLYSVDQSDISRIVNHKYWKHLL